MWFPGPFTSGGDRRAGSALVVVLVGLALLTALTTSAMLLATSDLLTATRQRDARIAIAAADAALERAAGDIVDISDWTLVLTGALTSPWIDGAASTPRVSVEGQMLSPQEVANLATCGAAIACSAEESAAVTAERPWGANNPRWRPFAYGVIAQSTPGQAATYVVVLAGDDPSENDGDPTRDGLAPDNPGAGIVVLRAEAFGPSSTRRVVEAAVARVTVAPGVALPRVLSWYDVR